MPTLQLKDVSHAYGALKVINDVNIVIEPGERHAIIGPNGAGKSTLINILSGKIRPTSGQVMLDGSAITPLGPDARSRLGIGRAFQIINVFPDLTVYENIESAVLARLGHAWNVIRRLESFGDVRDETNAVAERMSLSGKLDRPANTLAYGEQRRLEIALCLALDPKIMLLDEPCAGLNAEDAQDAISLIERTAAGRTLIIVEHDMDVVFGIAERVTVLHQGRVLCSDDAGRVRDNEDVRRAYLGGHDGAGH